MSNFPYKTALITGASSGIGKAFAYELAKKGLNLVLTARSEDKLNLISKNLIEEYKINVEIIVADLSSQNSAKELVDKIKAKNIQIDLLINNAGIGKWSNFLDQNMEIYHQMMQLNMNSLVELCHLLLPSMLNNNKGGILNIASTGALQPCPYIAVYCASKSFVLNFSESLHGEYSDKGIVVTSICPGNTKTNFQEVAKANTEGMNYETPQEVARQSIDALLKKKSNHIIGFNNKLQSLIPRLLPRKTVINIVKNMMYKKVNS